MLTPTKLNTDDEIRVIAPARSLSMISETNRTNAEQRFKAMGYNLTFSKNVHESNDFISSTIESRVNDIHDAFADQNVKMLITVIGGYNSNQILPFLDYKLIKQNPKIICGYSDITALANAIHAKTDLITYSGPHYSSFGEIKRFDYTLEYFNKCLTTDNPFEINPSKKWSKDKWYSDQENRNFIDNPGFQLIQAGEAEGITVGGNQRTFHYLAGTEFMPNLKDKILFIEEDHCENIDHFDSHLTALSQLSDANTIRAIIVGRFEPASEIEINKLKQVFANNKIFSTIPVIANVDFGHTSPMITFPIGGTARLTANSDNIKLEILNH